MSAASGLISLETDNSILAVDIWHNPGSSCGRAALILHPWSKLGGSMDDPTVAAHYRAAIGSGLFSAVVRYNMRGAGASKAKGWGKGLLGEPDVQDMLDVAHHVLTQLSPAPTQLYVIGYSYGACVAANSMQCLPQAVAGYVGIGFPLGAAAAFALGARKHWALLADSQVPKLLIHGTRDSFSPLSTLRDVVGRYHEATPPPGPLDLQIVDGADHFFVDAWDDVAQRTMAWLARLIETQAGSGSA